MADEQAGGPNEGIVQYIRLELSKESMQKFAADAEKGGTQAVNRMMAAIARAGGNTDPFRQVVEKQRRIFTEGMRGISTKLANEIFNPQQAADAADKLVRLVNTKIESGIRKIAKTQRLQIQNSTLRNVIGMSQVGETEFKTLGKAPTTYFAERLKAAERELVTDEKVQATKAARKKIGEQAAETAKKMLAEMTDEQRSQTSYLQIVEKQEQLLLKEHERKNRMVKVQRMISEASREALDQRMNDLEYRKRHRGGISELDQHELDLLQGHENRDPRANMGRRLTNLADRERAAELDALNAAMPGTSTPGQAGESSLQRSNRLAAERNARKELEREEAAAAVARAEARQHEIGRMREQAQNAKRSKQEADDLKRQLNNEEIAERELGDHLSARRARKARIRQDTQYRHLILEPDTRPGEGGLRFPDWASPAAVSPAPRRVIGPDGQYISQFRYLGPELPVGPLPLGQSTPGGMPGMLKQWRAELDPANAWLMAAGPKIKEGTAAIKGAANKLIDRISKFQKNVAGNLYDVPALGVISDATHQRIVPKNATIAQEQEITKRYLLTQQAMGTRTTRLGRLVGGALDIGRGMGLPLPELSTLSPQVSRVTAELEKLGVSSTKIGRLLPPVGAAVGGVGKMFGGFFKQFGMIFSVYAVVGFLKDVLHAAQENEVAWTRLTVTLNDYGIKLKDVREEVNQTFDQQAALGISYTKSAEILARLIQITGNYKGSLRAMNVVQDIVAAGYMTMEQATRATGRAMLGDVGLFSRYGIILNKTGDILGQLEKRFGGELLARSKTFAGQISTMVVQFDRLKVAIGDALIGDRTEGPLGDFIAALKSLKEFFQENSIAVHAWGTILGTIIQAVLLALMTVTKAFIELTTIVLATGSMLNNVWHNTPQVIKWAVGQWITIIGEGMQTVLQIVEGTWNKIAKIMHLPAAFQISNPGQAAESIIALGKQMAGEARKSMAENNQETRDQFTLLKGGDFFGVEPKDGSTTNTRRPVKDHATRMQEIASARRLLLSSNESFSERGAERLEGLQGRVQKLLDEENKMEDKDQGRLDDLQNEMEAINKAREQLEKQRNRVSAEERRYDQNIARMVSVAREHDDDAALEAVKELNAEHDKLIKKRVGLHKGSTEWLKNETRIRTVEEGILGRLDEQDKMYDQRIKDLGEMVDLHVNVQDAVKELGDIYEEAGKKATLAEATLMAQKFVGAPAKMQQETFREITRQRHRQAAAEGALRSEVDTPDKIIDDLEKELKDPAKRKRAEAALRGWQHRLEEKAVGAKTNLERTVAKNQADRIEAIMTGKTTINPSGTNRELVAVKELIKHGNTRRQGLKELEAIQARIQAQLDTEGIDEKEILELKSQQVRAEKLMHDAMEPNLNIIDEIKYIWEHDMVDIANTVADEWAGAFTETFALILRDSRNLSMALSAIPKGLAKSMLHEIAQIAQGKVKENLAYALEMTGIGLGMLASGNTLGAGQLFTAAAQHTAAAAAWGVLAGGATSLGVSANDAYANATNGGLGGSRGGGADNAKMRGPDIYLTIDGVDPKNPRHQRLVGETQREYRERYGGNIVMTGGTG